ncbi:hypothetical protein GGR57DRAFT_393226 [Xylariaceae sp. FL1272]|nr:hypothetical protein GGR57DRAFT_393226 [Xylariaceae sp. FL1272]
MANFGTAGWNPQFGYDNTRSGRAPPPVLGHQPGLSFPAQPGVAPVQAPTMPGVPIPGMIPVGMPGWNTNYAAYPGYPHFRSAAYNIPSGAHSIPSANLGPLIYGGVGTTHADMRPPTGHPRLDPQFPGMNVVNSTGGAGLEPGYHYLWHDDHAKVHVFTTKSPPWRAPGANLPYVRFYIPTNTKVGELMDRLGANNRIAKKNRIVEVMEGGNGNWYSGSIYNGGELEDTEKDLKSIGWNRSCSGLPGKRPPIWIWVTKD